LELEQDFPNIIDGIKKSPLCQKTLPRTLKNTQKSPYCQKTLPQTLKKITMSENTSTDPVKYPPKNHHNVRKHFHGP
jgi:hypothetical protein